MCLCSHGGGGGGTGGRGVGWGAVALLNSDQGKAVGTIAEQYNCGHSWGEHISHPGYRVAGLNF